MHIRRKLLDQIKAQLKAVTEFAGVWNQRSPPIRAAYPCITLYSVDEEIDQALIHVLPRCLDRNLDVSITVWIKGTPDDEKAEIDMDTMAELVEQVVKCPDLADRCTLKRTDFILDEEEADVHAISLNYQLVYETQENDPSTNTLTT